MATVYEHCTQDVAELAGELIEKFHSGLLDRAEPEKSAKIDYIFAELEPDDNGDKPDGDAVKLHGYPCLAVCRVIPAKQRALGRGDAEICIDKAKWEEMPVAQRRALLDHELEHIVVKRDGDGITILDPYDRPKLTMKMHDRQFGWFDNIADRHGEASFEVQQAHKLANEASCTYFQGEFHFLNSAPKESGSVSISVGGKKLVEMSADRFLDAAHRAGVTGGNPTMTSKR